jgi:hypothetical protein
MKDIAKCCKNADEFRDSAVDPGERGCSDKALGKLPSPCFVHRSIFEIFGKEGSMRAGDLATKALKNFSDNTEDESKKEEEDGDPEKRVQLLPFLRSVKNNWMNKVSLSEPLTTASLMPRLRKQ